ncbi:OB-fold domain-containing protein [Frankia sp. AgB1.9]|uniref:thiolase C-terminal domain-containing protein n=1 Tax=unclassified Frankia TaxID=2632575 RepID=UPI0019340DE1|nr:MULTISPECIES: OB-fold domain-containing protein [unclassified Frankia]MBL7493556.1 OB-fold domain-containing protein [Frankia sp. AgW1.1]MBL7549817.1 OB-fold domain-containing protein [Frankia sp. AgB1.9]MBL7622427.1 OB-fold domain-containing protein [Frankia sp. AgB1.8]
MSDADSALGPAVVRPLPAVTPHTRPFWTGGEQGELRLYRCAACGLLLHPSQVVCPRGDGGELAVHTVSGRGHVLSVSVNGQQWLPELPPPYVVAVVALADDPAVRLTTNVVGCAPEDVVIGMPVRVRFVQQEDVWLPLFEPDPWGMPVEATAASFTPLPPACALPRPARRPVAAGSRRFEERVAITGAAQSRIGRRLMRPPVELAVEACRAAVADAGLTMDDIDGLSTYPGGFLEPMGISEGGVGAVEEALRIHPVWINGGDESPGQLGSVIAAMLAVASGLCQHVLCFRTVWESTHTTLLREGQLALPPGGRVTGSFQYQLPFGAASAAQWVAQYASHYFARFGASRETLGWIALNARAHAGLNPAAIYRTPLTMDDYLAARTITTPFGLYDCDVPCDGATAFVVSAVDAARDLRAPVLVEAVGTALDERQSWDQGTVSHMPNVFGPAAHLWSRTSLRPADVDVALLYDGFSFVALSWLEALGFCGIGEAADFLDGGKRIGLHGELPLNPHGGQLSAGRTHGYGFLHEAVVQLRGDGGARQVVGARTAVVSAGGGVPAGCMLLRRD